MEKDMFIATVKFTKNGKDYEFLINKNLKLKDFKPNQVVLVRTKGDNYEGYKNKRAVLQDIKMEKRSEKNTPTSYIVKILEDSNFKLVTSRERRKITKEKLKNKRKPQNKNRNRRPQNKNKNRKPNYNKNHKNTKKDNK